MRSQLRQHPNPRSNAARKGSNFHAKPTGVKHSCEANFRQHPNPPSPRTPQHGRGQTFMRSQLRQHPNPRSNATKEGSNFDAKPTSPTSQPGSNAALTRSNLHGKPTSPTLLELKLLPKNAIHPTLLRSPSPRTALHWAALSGDAAVVAALLAAACDPQPSLGSA